jgi:hypothetical protein
MKTNVYKRFDPRVMESEEPVGINRGLPTMQATSITKLYLTVYYFYHSLSKMSFIYCHLNFHVNLLRPWPFPLNINMNSYG